MGYELPADVQNNGQVTPETTEDVSTPVLAPASASDPRTPDKIKALTDMSETMERYSASGNPVPRYHQNSQVILTDVHVDRVRKVLINEFYYLNIRPNLKCLSFNIFMICHFRGPTLASHSLLKGSSSHKKSSLITASSPH